MNQSTLRIKLDRKIKAEGLSLRDVERQCAVSFATVSRFLRGIGTISGRSHERLEDWLSGITHTKEVPHGTHRFRIGSKSFLVTIEELVNDH